MKSRLLKLCVLGALVAALCLAGAIPRPAPKLEFTSMDGQKVSLADLKGKVVLVMYFSTDCQHCQTAAQTLAPIYKELKPKGFEILGLAMNPTAKQNLGAFRDNYQAYYPMTTATRAEFSAFSGLSIMDRFYYPYFLFIDREGNVRMEEHGGNRAFFANLSRNVMEVTTKLLEGEPTS